MCEKLWLYSKRGNCLGVFTTHNEIKEIVGITPTAKLFRERNLYSKYDYTRINEFIIFKTVPKDPRKAIRAIIKWHNSPYKLSKTETLGAIQFVNMDNIVVAEFTNVSLCCKMTGWDKPTIAKKLENENNNCSSDGLRVQYKRIDNKVQTSL